MAKNLLLNKDFNSDNPTPRIPVCICIDVSSSMSGQPIKELNVALEKFFKAIYDNEDARYAAEICIIAFGDTAEVVSDFRLVAEKTTVSLRADGSTVIGTAINKGLDLLEERKRIYKANGTPYYQPWMIVMTDGCSYGESLDTLYDSIKRCNTLEDRNRIIMFPIGIGEEADFVILNKMSTRYRAFKVDSLQFEDFFEWLSQSIGIISSSQTGDTVNIPTQIISSWGEI